MNADKSGVEAKVESMPAPARTLLVTDELNKITEAVQATLPRDAEVSFEFDAGRLQINIDIRELEDLVRVEGQLPGLCGGIFSNIQRGLVDNRPFFHRLTARVDR